MVAISNYKEIQQSYSFPISYFTFQENYSQTQAGVKDIPEVMNLFSKLFGPYPFDKGKICHDRTWLLRCHRKPNKYNY